MFGSSARNSHLVLRTVRSAISRILRLLWLRALSARAEAARPFGDQTTAFKNAVGKTYAQKPIDLSEDRTLSETMVSGLPRRAMRPLSSRTTRLPDRDVSATRARHSRLKSSTIARTRNRRPSVKASETKSRLQRSLGRSGTAIGFLVPSARLRPPLRRTCRPSSRVEPAQFLLVHDDPLAFKHDVNATVAEPSALHGHRLDGGPKARIARLHAPISDARAVHRQNPARPTLAHRMLGTGVGHSVPLGIGRHHFLKRYP